MLADADEVDADLIGQHRLVDEIPNDFGGVQRRAIRSAGDVAESVEADFDNGLLLGSLRPGLAPPFTGFRRRLPNRNDLYPAHLDWW